MKANSLRKSVNVCLFVCVMCFAASVNNAKAQTLTQKYYYDSSRETVLKPVQTIYKPDESKKYLVPHLKYSFTYDEAGRVVKKEAHRWNTGSQSWKQSHVLHIAYEETCITIDYATWNKKGGDYASNKERAVYTLHNEELISYACFKQVQNSEEWMLVADISEIQQEILLIADMYQLQIDPLLILKSNLLAESK